MSIAVPYVSMRGCPIPAQQGFAHGAVLLLVGGAGLHLGCATSTQPIIEMQARSHTDAGKSRGNGI